METVSIPNRVLGIFRQYAIDAAVEFIKVSIPNRVLGIFRLGSRVIAVGKVMFQSLIGF